MLETNFLFLSFEILTSITRVTYVFLSISLSAFKEISLGQHCLTTEGAHGTKWVKTPTL